MANSVRAKVRRIITQKNAHLDSICAALLLQRESEKAHPGVNTAKICPIWSSGTFSPDGRSWQEYLETGDILVGVGGGPYDEHRNDEFGDRKARGESALSLVAKALGLAHDCRYRRLVEEVTKADLGPVEHLHPANVMKAMYRDGVPQGGLVEAMGSVDQNFLLFFQDEMRSGLISNYRRSWSPVGIRTVIDNQQAFFNRYLFSAVAPLSGESFHLIGLEENSSAMVALFFDELTRAYPDRHLVVVFDNAPSHRPKIVREREKLTCIYLPPYSPELNPAERFFGEIRKATANQIFATLNEQERLIEQAVKTLSADEPRMKRLTGYDWITNQIRRS